MKRKRKAWPAGLEPARVRAEQQSARTAQDLAALLAAVRPFTGSVDIGDDAIARFAAPFSAVQTLRTVVATIDARGLGNAAAAPASYEDRDRERFGASLLEAILQPPMDEAASPGTLAYAAHRLGRELARLRAGAALLDVVVAELLRLEWAGWNADEDRCCPVCNARTFQNPHGVHKSTCTIDAVLTRAGLVTQEQRDAKRPKE